MANRLHSGWVSCACSTGSTRHWPDARGGRTRPGLCPRKQGLYFWPDRERVVTPLVGDALGLPGIDP